ncbi:MAG: xylulokinase [Christensenellaceae bacterium]
MEQYILAHDFGTSGDKASLFTTEGVFIGSVTVNYDTHYSNGTWADQNPEDWWNAFCKSNKELLKSVDATAVLGVVFSGHYPGCIPVGEDGVALNNAIIWQDARAEKEAKEISEKTRDSDCGWRIDGTLVAASTIATLLWLRNNKPTVYQKIHKVLICPNDYIIEKLTGKYVVERSIADTSGFYDRNTGEWSSYMVEAAEIDPAILPVIHEPTDIIGIVPANLTAETGLSETTKVICGTSDGMCGNLGAGCLDPGDAYISGGSSAWVQVIFNKADVEEGEGYDGVLPGTVGLGDSMQAAGSSFSWMKNELCAVEQYRAEAEGKDVYDLINETIATSPAGAKGVMFLPHMMGERAPRWNPKAKGSFVGLSLETKRADMIRAVAEGIAFNLNVILRSARKYGEVPRLIMVGGLAKGKEVRQIFADIMNAEIIMLDHMDDLTSMGAAVIGGMALGIYEDVYAIRQFHKIIDVRKPNAETRAVYEKMEVLYDKMYFAQEPLFEAWANL